MSNEMLFSRPKTFDPTRHVQLKIRLGIIYMVGCLT